MHVHAPSTLARAVAAAALVSAACASDSTAPAPGEARLQLSSGGHVLNPGDAPSDAAGTDFGLIAIGNASPVVHVFTVANTGDAAAPLGAVVRIDGDAAADFSIAGTLPETLPAGGAVELQLAFAPRSEGLRAARLVVGAARGDLAYALAGEGAAPHLALLGYADAPLPAGAPARASAGTDFGVLRPGGRALRTFRVRNVGRAPLHVSAVSCEGAGAAWFDVAPPADTTLAPGAEAALTVAFAPDATGTAEAEVRIANDSPDRPAASFAVRGSAATGEAKLLALQASGLMYAFPFDVDGDGDLDVFGAAYTSSRTVVYRAYRNDGAGTFTDATLDVLGSEAETQNTPRHHTIADLDGDGLDDVVVGSHGQEVDGPVGGQSLVFLREAGGHMRDATAELFPAVIAFTHDLDVADVDGDGDLDVYLSNIWGLNPVGPEIYVNPGDGSTFVRAGDRVPTELVTLTRKFTASRFLDVDRDGDQDLVLGFHEDVRGPRDVADTILLNDGKGFFTYAPPDAMPPRRGGPETEDIHIATGDVNSDGIPDLATVHAKVVNGVTVSAVQVSLGRGDGTFVDDTRGLPDTFDAYKLYDFSGLNTVTIRDVDQDGRPDLVVDGNAMVPAIFRQEADGAFAVWKTFDAATSGLGKAPFQLLTGDFDGDGIVDLLLTYP